MLAEVYTGDNNQRLKQAQHAVRADNIWRLFDESRNAFSRADGLLRAGLLVTQRSWQIARFDACILQDAHDILAAAYRHGHDDGGQMQLFAPPHLPTLVQRWPDYSLSTRYSVAWSAWLQSKLSVLIENPRFVCSTIDAVVNATNRYGMMARHDLCSELVSTCGLDGWARKSRYAQTYTGWKCDLLPPSHGHGGLEIRETTPSLVRSACKGTP